MGLCGLSWKQRAQKYHTTTLWQPLTAWHWDMAQLVAWSNSAWSRRHDKHWRDTEQQGCTAHGKRLPDRQCSQNHSQQGLLLPHHKFSGVQNVTRKVWYCLFILFLFTAPEGALALCNCFSLFFCHLWIFPWHTCPEAIRLSCQPWGHLHLAELMSNAGRAFSEDKRLGFYRERAWSENCSISPVPWLEMLAESSRKAGKSPGRAGRALALQRLARWLCSSKSLVPSISTPDLVSEKTRVTCGPWASSYWFMAISFRKGLSLSLHLHLWRLWWNAFSKQETQSFLNAVKKGCFPDPMKLHIYVSGSAEVRKMWIQTLTLAEQAENCTQTSCMPGECSMDWCVLTKVGTTPKPLQLEKPKPATVDKLSSKDT